MLIGKVVSKRANWGRVTNGAPGSYLTYNGVKFGSMGLLASKPTFHGGYRSLKRMGQSLSNRRIGGILLWTVTADVLDAIAETPQFAMLELVT